MIEKFVTYGIPTGWNIIEEGQRMHTLNQKWWRDLHTNERIKLNWGERLMLVVTEIAEAAEGYRKSKMDEHIPRYKNEIVEICDALIRMFDLRCGYGYQQDYEPIEYVNEGITDDNVLHALGFIVGDVDALRFLVYQAPDELDAHAIAIDRIITALFQYAFWRGYGSIVREVYEAKVAYNQVRLDHTREHRLSEHGKKV